MNMKDKTRTVTVRLTEEQYQFLRTTAKTIEVTPSRFLRMVVNATMEVKNVEHSKADQHDLVEQRVISPEQADRTPQSPED